LQIIIKSIGRYETKTSKLDLFGTAALMSISSTSYARIFCTKVLFSSYVLAKKALSYKKFARKMLMKLTPGVVVD